MKTVAITKFKAQCLALLDQVAKSGQPLVVTKRGKPLARIVPTVGDEAWVQDSLRGSVTIVGDIMGPVVPRSRWNAARGVVATRRAAEPRGRRSR